MASFSSPPEFATHFFDRMVEPGWSQTARLNAAILSVAVTRHVYRTGELPDLADISSVE